MIRSDRRCGTCGNALLIKAFREAEILVCHTCQNITMHKADFKRLLQAPVALTPPPAPPAAIAPVVSPQRLSDPSGPSFAFGDLSAVQTEDGPEFGRMMTDETEEFTRGPVISTVAPTEMDGTGFEGWEEEEAFDRELEQYQSRKSRGRLIAAVAIIGLALVLVSGLAVVGVAGLAVTTTGPDNPAQDAAGPRVADPEVAPAVPDPAVEPAASHAPGAAPPALASPDPPSASPEPVAPDPVAPDPVAPDPVAPEPAGVSALVRRGWTAFDRSAAEAEAVFREALAVDAQHADANYGYGYALLKLGRASEAAPYLCKARNSGDAEIGRDIRALLNQNRLSCE